VAHGLHPNKIAKMDVTNHPVLGSGFCIKEACSQSYATDAEAIAILCQICDSRGIPYQRFVNRSDMRGGGTLGSIASSFLPVKTVDIGVPILAMHSARELMGAADMKALTDAVTAFFTA
jgi:aspartyl aminopeptidase